MPRSIPGEGLVQNENLVAQGKRQAPNAVVVSHCSQITRQIILRLCPRSKLTNDGKDAGTLASV